ncbi:MAG: hypothetical protein ACHQ1G_04440, partial [Planctomycetota bacterium]
PSTLRVLLAVALLIAACATPRPDPVEKQPYGPVVERTTEGKATITQFNPVWYKRVDEHGTAVNVFAPLFRYREDEVFRRVQVFPFVYYTARHAPAAEKSWFMIVFPLACFGTGDFLILPFGGYSNSLLGIDHLLVVTPLYARSRFVRGPAANPDVYTVHHVLWPLIHWGSDGKEGGRWTLRFMPFWGKTKGRGGFEKGFVLWPFYTWRRSPQSNAFFIFPFYGRDVGPEIKHTTIMFPFYMRTRDSRTGLVDTTLFPFYRRATGSERTEVRRYWPFYMYSRDGPNLTTLTAWPIWRRQYVDSEREFRRWTWVLPPFYRKTTAFRRADGATLRKTILWPIGRWQRNYDGYREIAFPVLWPYDGPSLREYAEPWRNFVSIYRRRTWPSGDRETTAAFGLYMNRRTPETRKVRFLWGFTGWDKTPEGTHLRLFWALRLRVSGPS